MSGQVHWRVQAHGLRNVREQIIYVDGADGREHLRPIFGGQG
jgi:hypothetical protein